MELIRTFDQIGKADAAIAGGKGASLGEMTQAGLPVPPGFVILASAFERFLKEADLNQEIDTILIHGVNREEMHTVEHASEKIQKLILDARMPEDICSSILQNYKTLGAQFVAVRSSATAEDSQSAAWAGQLDTFLNTTEENLLQNVQKCWASLFTSRAIFYRFEKNMHDQKISVAVVVQKMIESEVSGIAFSVHPVTQDANQMIIEAGFGLGEAIVSGQITPDSYVVEKNPRRIIRAIEIAQALGSVPLITKAKPLYNSLFIGLTLPPETLKKKIAIRLFARIGRGMIAEAKKLHARGLSWKRMEELGLEYRYLALHLQGKISKPEMIAKLQTEIWRYAKRQMTWFRRDKRIQWFHPTNLSEIQTRIKNFLA